MKRCSALFKLSSTTQFNSAFNLPRHFSATFLKKQQAKNNLQAAAATITDKTNIDVAARHALKDYSQERIDAAIQLLRDNYIDTVGHWKTLALLQKERFPSGIVTALDKAFVPNDLSLDEKIQKLQSMITVSAPPDTRPKFLFQHFVHREQATKIATFAAMNNFHAYQNNKSEGTKKQDHSFIIIPGGSGSGKTRASCEIANILREQCKLGNLPAPFCNTHQLYVEFSNGDRIGTISNEAKRPRHAVGVRLFVKALTSDGNVSVLMSRLGEDCVTNLFEQGVFDLDAVLTVISAKYHQWLDLASNATLPLVIVMDEFQQTLQFFSTPKELAKILGDIMCVTTGANPHLKRHNILLLPVIAGTVVRDMSFELTEYDNQVVELPLFPLPIVKRLALEEGLPMHVLQGREKTRFWLLMGLVPRSLEYAVNTALEFLKRPQFQGKQLVGYDDKLFTEALFTTVEELLRSKYKISTTQHYTGFKDQDESLLTMAAIGVPIQQDVEWITRLERQGQIYLDDHRRVFLPYIVFVTLRDRYSSFLPKSLLPALSSSFTWQMFEMLDATLLALRINYYVTLGKASVCIRDLWPGAYCGYGLTTFDIHITFVSVANETRPYISQDKGLVTIMNDNPVIIDTEPDVVVRSNQLNHYILHAMEGHARTDARWFTSTATGTPLLIVMQYKYMAEPSEANTKEDQPNESPLHWYESFVPQLKRAYKGYKVIAVYVTNANIPKKAQEAVTKYPGNLLVIDASVNENYFAPNIFPYVQTMEPKAQT